MQNSPKFNDNGCCAAAAAPGARPLAIALLNVVLLVIVACHRAATCNSQSLTLASLIPAVHCAPLSPPSPPAARAARALAAPGAPSTHPRGSMAKTTRPRRRTSTAETRADHARFVREWRRKRRASQLLRNAKSRRRTQPVSSRTPTMTTRSGHADHLNFKIDRLREFQTWYRTVALPSQRCFQTPRT